MKAFSKDLRQQRLVPLLLLLAILLLALLLRIFQLDTESLWLDEAISVDIADHNLVGVLESRP